MPGVAIEVPFISIPFSLDPDSVAVFTTAAGLVFTELTSTYYFKAEFELRLPCLAAGPNCQLAILQVLREASFTTSRRKTKYHVDLVYLYHISTSIVKSRFLADEMLVILVDRWWRDNEE